MRICMFLGLPDPHPDPLGRGPDPYQNVTDPQHSLGAPSSNRHYFRRELVEVKARNKESETSFDSLEKEKQKLVKSRDRLKSLLDEKERSVLDLQRSVLDLQQEKAKLTGSQVRIL
jgi:hypothetical protein